MRRTVRFDGPRIYAGLRWWQNAAWRIIEVELRAVQALRHGGPEVLTVAEFPSPTPAPGQLLVACAVAGVNFADVYVRTGLRSTSPHFPFGLGIEGVGRVVGVGDGVDRVRVGDRIAWRNARSSYAEQVLVASSEAIPVPGTISDELAAGVVVQGLTAQYLATAAYAIQPGDTALVHAAAGGVGLLLTQLIGMRGGRVIGTASTNAKLRAVLDNGAEHALLYDNANLVSAVRDLTSGAGADVVYDGVGGATFEVSLACARTRGVIVIYGTSSGPVPPFDLDRLLQTGSQHLTRPNLADYVRTHDELLDRSTELFRWVTDGSLTVHIGGRYRLHDAQSAHRDLEGRQTVGKLLLFPQASE